MGIDFREHDQRERAVPVRRDDGLEFRTDPALAQRIREGLDRHGEEAAFAAAERRMRGGRRRG
ncbi:hypothetical protein [Rhodanobacter lindaniclasticus]